MKSNTFYEDQCCTSCFDNERTENIKCPSYELAKAKRGLMVFFEIVGRDISVIEYFKSFHLLFANTLENKYYSILLQCLRRMCDIISMASYIRNLYHLITLNK